MTDLRNAAEEGHKLEETSAASDVEDGPSLSSSPTRPLKSGSEYDDYHSTDMNFTEGICCRADIATSVSLFRCPSFIAIRGQAAIRVIQGAVNVGGYWIDKRHGVVPLFSPSTHCALTLLLYEVPVDDAVSYVDSELKKHTTLTPLKLQQLLNGVSKSTAVILWTVYYDKLTKHLMWVMPKLNNVDVTENVLDINSSLRIENCALTDARHKNAFRIPAEWNHLALQLLQAYDQNRPLRVLICGGKKAGKSTLMRFLINSFLNRCNSVHVLDADPGQAEFLPPGCVSLIEATEPLLGPSFTHHKTPVKCCFVGGINVSQTPEHYVECVKFLFEIFQKKCGAEPLFINTMGWTKGIGLSLLVDLVYLTSPTHIIQINNTTARHWNMAKLTPNFVAEESGWLCCAKNSTVPDFSLIELQSVAVESNASYSPLMLRSLNVCAYFSQFHQVSDHPMPINCHTPFKVPWSAVAVFVCNETVPNHQVLYALNGSVVALSVCDPSLFHESVDKSLPKFLTEIPVCECVGYGIVRGISVEEKVFYIITPLRFSVLRRVNTVLKGSVDIPPELLLLQKIDGRIPYAMRVPQAKAVVGDRVLRKRTFRERGGQY